MSGGNVLPAFRLWYSDAKKRHNVAPGKKIISKRLKLGMKGTFFNGKLRIES